LGEGAVGVGLEDGGEELFGLVVFAELLEGDGGVVGHFGEGLDLHLLEVALGGGREGEVLACGWLGGELLEGETEVVMEVCGVGEGVFGFTEVVCGGECRFEVGPGMLRLALREGELSEGEVSLLPLREWGALAAFPGL
jgi:hypothetical protein